MDPDDFLSRTYTSIPRGNACELLLPRWHIMLTLDYTF